MVHNKRVTFQRGGSPLYVRVRPESVSRKVVFRKGCTEEGGALRKCPVDIFSEGASLLD